VKASDTAWALIAGAHGHVRGKVFLMSAVTFATILFERGQPARWAGRRPRSRGTRYETGRFLYGVPVVIDTTIRNGEIRLERR
jgi:hypothetical protein